MAADLRSDEGVVEVEQAEKETKDQAPPPPPHGASVQTIQYVF